ncbi:MAG: PadR family transcriptional regulator [Bacteroidetes bacterium]|jgi:DNA-binding PadR family transcriptional regulator|nr:PadR family transcriptional regulator [Bacteroidota bacterium]
MQSNELIKGTLKTIILNLLKENGRMYGYEITQAIQEITKGEIKITEGSLYPALHGLVAEGMLITESVNIGKRVRKYYRLTKEGKVETKKKLTEFSDYIVMMQGLLNLKPSI